MLYNVIVLQISLLQNRYELLMTRADNKSFCLKDNCNKGFNPLALKLKTNAFNYKQMTVNTYWQRKFPQGSLCVSGSPPGIWRPRPLGSIPFPGKSRPSWAWMAETLVCSHLDDRQKAVSAADMITLSVSETVSCSRWPLPDALSYSQT